MILVWNGNTLVGTPEKPEEIKGIEYCFKLSSVFLQEYLTAFLLQRAKQAIAVEKHELFQAFSALPDSDKIKVNELINKTKSI